MKYAVPLIISLFLIAAPAQAQKPLMQPQPMPAAQDLVPVPEDWQKLWLIKSCEKGELSYRFSDAFLLMSIPQGSKLFRIGGLIDNGAGRYSMVMPAETLQFVEGSKGDLIQIFGNQPASFSVEALENKQIMVPHIYFKPCEDQTTKVNEDKAIVAMMPRLDQVSKACPERGDIYKKDCQKAVFGLFDQNGDDAIDLTEMKSGWDLAIANSSFGTCGTAATPADVLRREGTAYFDWLFEHLDQNKDQKVSFTEIDGQWKTMQGDPLMSGATNLLLSAEKPIAIMPPSAQMTCTNCCISSIAP